jgi:hypothetical protein
MMLQRTPRLESLFNMVTRRIRAAKTMFADNVKLDLRQYEKDHWSKLPLPYLLVVPTQTKAPRDIDVDDNIMVNPRMAAFVAQFNGRNSEGEHLAANDIETAEKQLIATLCNWRPWQNYKPTIYSGMRIEGTREPDVKAIFLFTFNEWVSLPEDSVGVDGDDGLEPLVLDRFDINMHDSCCNLECPPEPGPMPAVCITGGCLADAPDDPCAEPEPCYENVEEGEDS